jgi:hypothetical protein
VFDIFINYRACDARFGAAATFELLADHFDRSRIFGSIDVNVDGVRCGMGA